MGIAIGYAGLDLPPEVSLAVPDAFLPGDAKTLAAVEREYITAVLKASGGNRTKAAAALGIGAATLYRKLKMYDDASGATASRV